MNHSPRLDQLTPRSFFPVVQQDFSTDVVIVWWGIAGISTLYYVLKNTDRKVTLLESYKIAHGASWHNAGQIVPYFEKPFVEIVEEYGITMANQWQQAMLDARERVQELVVTLNMESVFEKFIGYAGCSTIEQIIENLQKNAIQDIQHIQYETILVSEECPDREKIPSMYEDRIHIVSQRRINQLLQTKGNKFIGVLARHAGTLNSALFCEKALQHITNHYHDRVQIYEFSPVDTIDLYEDKVKITTNTSKVNHLKDTPTQPYTGTIKAKQIILCTNGFEKFTINNHSWPEINKDFHEEVNGLVWYISGYLDIAGQSPLAISYYLKPGELEAANDVENYFYLTRRQFHKDNQIHSLICIGGPETNLHEKDRYMRHEAQPERAHEQMDNFLKQTFRPHPEHPTKYHYRRHGLMWFTKSWLRIIWPDTKNPKLLYNIGCNGVWILSSIHGWRKISQFLLGNITQPSIFDPQ
jgi:glycine/D-amino acid oxidase-like deaminating enzyme